MTPLQEHVFTGDAVDLEKLPVPWLSKEEGGRYIGTWHLNVSKDPENGTRNIGVYRMQLLGRRRTAISMSGGSHLAQHLAKARRNGAALEMAVAIGVNEPLVMAAGASFPLGADEYCVAGGISGEAVALCSCSTVDVEIPAHAEIVLEGNIDPEIRVQEYRNPRQEPCRLRLRGLLPEVSGAARLSWSRYRLTRRRGPLPFFPALHRALSQFPWLPAAADPAERLCPVRVVQDVPASGQGEIAGPAQVAPFADPALERTTCGG